MERRFEKLGFSFIIIFLLALNANAGGAIAGKVTILKGQVYIKRGAVKIMVKKDDTVLESDIIEAEAGTARITMIDSNLVDIYPRTKVEIAKYVYKPNQDQKDVELKVDFGKIKSTVKQKYDGAKNKFQVKTPSAVAGVRGTIFTTEYDAVKRVSRVITIEGLVAVTKMVDLERQSAPVFVRPDHAVKVDIEQSKTEQPKELSPEERESHQQEDKDLGFQQNTKKDQSAEQKPSQASSQQSPKNIEPGIKHEVAEPSDSEQAQSGPREPIKEIAIMVKEAPLEQIREPLDETAVRVPMQTMPDMAIREPVLPEKEIIVPAAVMPIRENITSTVNNIAEQQLRLQLEQERSQKEAEELQAQRLREMEEAQKKAEAARLLQEITNSTETIIRPPSGSTLLPTSPNTIGLPK